MTQLLLCVWRTGECLNPSRMLFTPARAVLQCGQTPLRVCTAATLMVAGGQTMGLTKPSLMTPRVPLRQLPTHHPRQNGWRPALAWVASWPSCLELWSSRSCGGPSLFSRTCPSFAGSKSTKEGEVVFDGVLPRDVSVWRACPHLWQLPPNPPQPPVLATRLDGEYDAPGGPCAGSGSISC